MILNADTVAIAIVAAARETGADPVAVASGQIDDSYGGGAAYPISRARSYAAVALHNLFYGQCDFGSPIFARMVGVSRKSEAAFFGGLDSRKRKGSAKWWDEKALERVRAAVCAWDGHQSRVMAVAERTIQSGGTISEFAARIRAQVPAKVTSLAMRRDPVPAEQCQDVTAEFFGDPPAGRSALDSNKESK